MAEVKRFPLWFFWALAGYLIVSAVIVSYGAKFLGGPSRCDLSHPGIREGALAVVGFWSLAWPLVLRTHIARLVNTHWFLVFTLRWLWSLGCVMCLLHIATAFHVGHGWSHSAAWEHTRQMSGFGFGIYVNYLFVLVWFLDVLWMWYAFNSYLNRPQWLNWGIHGFIAFVVFNAAVVYGTSESREVFGKFFSLTLAFVSLQVIRRRRAE